jgi:hypothetical protein
VNFLFFISSNRLSDLFSFFIRYLIALDRIYQPFTFESRSDLRETRASYSFSNGSFMLLLFILRIILLIRIRHYLCIQECLEFNAVCKLNGNFVFDYAFCYMVWLC